MTTDDDVPEGYMSGAEFARHVSPVTTVLRDLVAAARADRPQSALPAVNSRAMSELSVQPMFDHEEGVIDVALTSTVQRVHAGEDQIVAVCALLDVESESFVWSLPVLGRAALEAFAHAAHVSDPGASGRLRAARMMNDLIASGHALDRLAPEIDRPRDREQYRINQAIAMKLTRVTNKKGNDTPWFEEFRPGYAQLVIGLFETDRLGATIYNAWSAVAHSATWSFSQSIGETQAHPAGVGVRAAVVLTLEAVTMTALTLILGHSLALQRLAEWTGWTFPTYAAAYAEHQSTIHTFFGEAGLTDKPEIADVARMSNLLWLPGQGL